MGTARLLLLLLSAQSWLASPAVSTLLIGEVNDQIVLPCTNEAINKKKVGWFKDNANQPILPMDNNNSSDNRFSRVNNSSLVITSLQLADEGNYTCSVDAQTANSEPHLQLRVSSGPQNVSASIFPVKTLLNGTLYTFKGSNLEFLCSSYSYPVPQMEWVLYAQDKNPELFHSDNSSVLNYTITNVAPDYQGNYSCSAKNPLTNRTVTATLELLVYHKPNSNISCYANNSVDHSQLLLSCRWTGGYPSPKLQWEQDNKALADGTSDTDTLMVSVNRSQLSDGQQFSCRGSHLVIEGTSDKTCQLHIALPLLQSQPMRTCFSGENITLSCSVSGSNPLATISWLHNLSDPEVEIQPGEKYHIWQNSSLSYLTILNCSHERDEGYYVCKAENVLGKKEINVWLSVNKPHNIVGLVSILLLLFLLVIAIITGTVLYCDPQVYLKANPFRSGATDLLVLVDSDDEEEMVEIGEPIDCTNSTDADTRDRTHTNANGNISKHEVMYHQPPDRFSSDLIVDITEDKEENPSEEI